MRQPGRESALYGVVGMVLVVSIALAVWLKDVRIFFSGALVAFTMLLWNVNRNTLALQKRFDKREHAKANPKPIFHDMSRLEQHIGFNTDKREGILKLIFSVSNPGDNVMLIESVEIREDAIGSPVASQVKWLSRYPVLASSFRATSYNHGFPAPVFADGMTELTTYFNFHDGKMQSAAQKLDSFDYSITYRLGDSDETKSADWTRHG